MNTEIPQDESLENTSVGAARDAGDGSEATAAVADQVSDTAGKATFDPDVTSTAATADDEASVGAARDAGDGSEATAAVEAAEVEISLDDVDESQLFGAMAFAVGIPTGNAKKLFGQLDAFEKQKVLNCHLTPVASPAIRQVVMAHRQRKAKPKTDKGAKPPSS